MAENETQTVGDTFRAGKGEGTTTPRDTIKGWNNRRQSNNQIISSMVPFVQLIGIFNEEEYRKLFRLGAEDRVSVHYSDDDEGQTYDAKKPPDGQKSWLDIEKELGPRFINLYMLKSVDHGLNVAATNGIIMAEKVSQVKDASGGIGITDLQVDYGKSNVLGARKFTMRMTINDPKILDDRFEYSKLATFGSQFLILYGWSNPEVIPGYDAAMPPPKLEGDPITGNPPTRDRLIVPLRNLGNGGYWSAARVNISEYNFGFNEMGKLEISIVFRDEATLGMSSTTLSSVSKQVMSFLSEGTLDRIITGSKGQTFTLRDALYARQLEKIKQYNKIASDNEASAEGLGRTGIGGIMRTTYATSTADAHADLVAGFGEGELEGALLNVIDIEGNALDLTVDQAAPEGDNKPFANESDVNARVMASRETQMGYPDQVALYVWKQKFTTVVDTDPSATSDADEEEADAEGVASTDVPTKQVVDYDKKPGYYFLGAIMDSLSLSMANTTVGLGSPKVPTFFYRDINSDSKLNTAFQSKIKSENSNTTLEEKIQEGVIRLKERWLPPSPRGHERVGDADKGDDKHWRAWYAAADRAGIGRNDPWNNSTVVSGTQPVYEGEQTEQKTRVIRALFPAPPKAAHMAGAPMRGHFTVIQTSADSYAQILSEKGLEGVGDLQCFIPDWKQETNFDPEGNELISSGSPDGFDPTNPTEYRAAAQASAPDFQPAPDPLRDTRAATLEGDEFNLDDPPGELVEIGTYESQNEGDDDAMARIRARDEAAGIDTSAPEYVEPQTTQQRNPPVTPAPIRPTGIGGFPVVPERSQEPHGRGGRFFMIMSKGDDPVKKVILTYDTWRSTNKETWNLLQKKWNNYYRDYLASYFERLIRLRVIETQMLGMPLETLYAEPIDLDWMTGVIYDNNYFEGGGQGGSWIKSYADIGNAYASDFDLEAEEIKLNKKVADDEETIARQTAIIEGKRHALNYDYTSEGASVADYYGLRGAVRRLVDKINKIKLEIEQLTGGFYERDDNGKIVTIDVMGNKIMTRFKNFNKVVPSETEFDNEGVQYEQAQEISAELMAKGGPALAARIANPIMISYTVAVYKPEIEYEYIVEAPKMKEEWILWNDYQVPTDNFQNQFNTLTREWVETDRPNKAQRWKQLNVRVYNNNVLTKLKADQKIINDKLNTIRRYQDELSVFYGEYQESKTAINNAKTNIKKMKKVFESYSEFFNEENNRLELDLYDDTSAFDGEGLYKPMGRNEPMHLTTKVAQQWARRFTGIIRRGVIDVRNYGPPKGGKEYILPTNVYRWRFDKARRNWGVMGTPRRVLDPEVFQRIEPTNSTPSDSIQIQNGARLMLGDLSYRVNKDSSAADILSKNLPYEDIHIGRITEKGYQNWSLFGNPGIPNDFGNNQWGFSYGPPIERDLGGDNIEIVGGNYVRTYKDFLDLFGKAYISDWPDPLRIVGPWPMPMDTTREVNDLMETQGMSDAVTRRIRKEYNDAERLMENGSANIPVYTLIDETGNILVDDGDGWYHPTGWYLDFDGDPVFLYPSRQTACKINNTSKYVSGVRPGGALETGHLGYGSHGIGFRGSRKPNAYDRQMAAGEATTRDRTDGAHWDYDFRERLDAGDEFSGRNRTSGQAIQDELATMGKDWWSGVTALFAGDIVKFAKEMAKWNLKLLSIASMAHMGALSYGAGAVGFAGPAGYLRRATYGKLTEEALGMYVKTFMSQAMKRLNPDGLPQDYRGNKPSWGARIGIGEHCPNLTLDMKRSMIINRQTTEDETSYLGYDMAAGAGWGPINKKINWGAITKIGKYYVLKSNHNIYADYSDEKIVDGKKVPAGSVTGPIYEDADDPEGGANATYSNTEYPYGTGFYRKQHKQHGPYIFPDKKKNWVDWGDLLQQLPGYGFFTTIDNTNYTPCMVQPNGAITDGLELNEGFVKFIIENVYAPLPKNRRCGCPEDHTPIKIITRNLSSYHDAERLNDVTYGDILGPLRDPNEDDEATSAEATLAPPSYGSMENFKIDNIKNFPIQAGLINNLVNKNNTNMSVTQFLGEILRPGAIGVNNAGNTQAVIRQGEDGDFEVFCPTAINWTQEWKDYEYLLDEPLNPADEYIRRFPKDIMVLDFKTSDSLIENLDMNSTFDPIVARAFKDAAADYTGSTDKLLEFLSYKDMAPDLIKYLEADEAGSKFQAADDGGPKAITLDKDNNITLDKSLLFDIDDDGVTTPKDGVQDSIQRFLQMDPQRLNALRALEQAAGSGGNYATTLLANYMRKTTITIHGTTNISPFQKIIIRGIMPNLEGMYIITNTRESITPQGFQTILEGSLVRPPSTNARTNKAGEDIVPQESTQPHIDLATAANWPSPAPDVEEASELEDSLFDPAGYLTPRGAEAAVVLEEGSEELEREREQFDASLKENW